MGGDFTLTAHNGKRLRLSELHGKIVLLFFGYVDCPDVCTPTLAKLAQARAQLGKEGERVQGVFISLDPARDTPARLGPFLSQFDPSFIGLTGSPAEVAAVAKDYKIAFHHHAAGAMSHTDGTFVVDDTGKVRLYVRGDMPLQDIIHDLRILSKTRR